MPYDEMVQFAKEHFPNVDVDTYFESIENRDLWGVEYLFDTDVKQDIIKQISSNPQKSIAESTLDILKTDLPECKESMETKHKRASLLRLLLRNLREELI